MLLSVGLVVAAAPAWAQERRPIPTRETVEQEEVTIADKLRTIINPVDLQRIQARSAFEWWSKATGVPLIINWDQMQNEGVSSETEITLQLNHVPAGRLLSIMMKQSAGDTPLIMETTPWYVQVMTKAEANKTQIVRVYDLGDLIHEPMKIGKPPRFDLGAALSNSSSGGDGGSSGSSGTSIFEEDTGQEREKTKSVDERSEEIAKVIRDTIEPEIWEENGGQFGSIRVFQGRLVVRAPAYVQAQIGMPSVGGDRPRSRASRELGTAGSSGGTSTKRTPTGEMSNGVSAVHPIQDETVSSKASQ
jgi:hypothetical protein